MKYIILFLMTLMFSSPADAGWLDSIKNFFRKESQETVSTTQTLDTTLSIVDALEKAVAGDVKAQFLLGEVYRLGSEEHGIAKDAAEAVKWYQLAAEQGDASSQYHLAFMFYDGEGVDLNYDEAFKWFHKSAEQEFAAAQYNVATMYKMGKGVEADDAKAVEWLKKAAENGNQMAQLGLGTVYESGILVEKDYVKSYMWLSLAAMQGFDVAEQFRDFMAGQLTPEQISEAEKLIKERQLKR